MKITQITIDDLPEVAKLFERAKYPQEALETISTTGLIAKSDEGETLGTIFLYFTNSTMCYVDNLCVDPEVHKELKTTVIDSLMKQVSLEVEKTQQYKLIISEPIHTKSKERLKEYGYSEGRNGRFWKKVA